MLIDCDTCAMRDIACSDCVMTMLFDVTNQTDFDDDERRAVDALAEAGLIAPLRLVPMLATSPQKSQQKSALKPRSRRSIA